jgi:hypothetical protein
VCQVTVLVIPIASGNKDGERSEPATLGNQMDVVLFQKQTCTLHRNRILFLGLSEHSNQVATDHGSMSSNLPIV